MTGFSDILMGAVVAASLSGVAMADDPSRVTSGDLCPASLSSLADGIGTVVSCWCPAGLAAGSVWGSGPYTIDSNLCTAARHAGAIAADGGAIWARVTGGERSYPGSVANGVKSSEYGSFSASLVIAARTGVAPGGIAACPASMQGRSGMLTCKCAAGVTAAGSVWGTDIYTEDSAVCRAAVHAGAIGVEGGTVSVVTVGGQPKYVGSERNGVASSNYGAWGASYMFAN